jgi:hypothetical protein
MLNHPVPLPLTHVVACLRRHNGRTLGYEPWLLGFQDSWLPSSHVHLDNLMRHNGEQQLRTQQLCK